MGLFFAGDIFLLWLLIMPLVSQGTYPHGIMTYYSMIIVVGIIWNTTYTYFILNCPKKIQLSEEGLIVKWRRDEQEFYGFKMLLIENFGTVRVIKLNDPSWKLPRYLLLDGWSKEYRGLLESIETSINK